LPIFIGVGEEGALPPSPLGSYPDRSGTHPGKPENEDLFFSEITLPNVIKEKNFSEALF